MMICCWRFHGDVWQEFWENLCDCDRISHFPLHLQRLILSRSHPCRRRRRDRLQFNVNRSLLAETHYYLMILLQHIEH